MTSSMRNLCSDTHKSVVQQIVTSVKVQIICPLIDNLSFDIFLRPDERIEG